MSAAPPAGEPSDTAPDFAAGRVVQRREVLHGRLWMSHPVTVVDDGDGVLAVLLEPGSPFTYAEHPFGQHAWAPQPAWESTTVLMLHRDGDPYAAWAFFEGGRRTGWYVNLEAPVVRHPDGTGGGSFDTDDHGLDMVVPQDGPWRWKDLDDPAAMAASGRMTAAEAEQVHADGRAVAALLDADERWWSRWDAWTPSDPTAPST